MYFQNKKEARQQEADSEKNATNNGVFKDKTIVMEPTKSSTLDTTVVENGNHTQGVDNVGFEKWTIVTVIYLLTNSKFGFYVHLTLFCDKWRLL